MKQLNNRRGHNTKTTPTTIAPKLFIMFSAKVTSVSAVSVRAALRPPSLLYRQSVPVSVSLRSFDSQFM